ncbi:MAG: chemotaxis protein CheW [Gallionella sp.]|nr:chemotaxis protein CheW [Gallionella sp.]
MSKRLNLREFQQNLINQLQAENLSVARVSTLGVQIGGQNRLVEMVDVGEVLSLPALTAVPFTKPWFRGVANVRGNLYGVVDVAAYRQTGAASGDINNRILLVADRYAFNVALLVDNVLGLRDARNWKQYQVDGQIEYQDEQGTFWQKLDVSALLGQEEFLQIGS